MFQRTRLTAVAASGLLLFGAAARGPGESDDKAAPSGDSAAKGAFPVTLDHEYGTTTVKNDPQRIVTVGLSDQDAVLALGKAPVGTTEWFGAFQGATGPWAEKELGDKARPTVLHDDGTGPQVDKIASLRPDLILALIVTGVLGAPVLLWLLIRVNHAGSGGCPMSTAEPEPELRAEGLHLGYDDRPVVSGLDLAVPPGRIIAIVGANACGQSTLLRAPARLLAPRDGAVSLDGRALHTIPTRELAQRLGILPQSPVAPAASSPRARPSA